MGEHMLVLARSKEPRPLECLDQDHSIHSHLHETGTRVRFLYSLVLKQASLPYSL